ncbi:hypothetical protein J2W49_002003 [Hydrogenophaga palleronii]|uniref:Isopropylmalate isomerase n=1 Tax=Hydrogenophaga palleronii TaxID=65655 RepID=A0ABU1WL78_9BURK|nr:hypothetical protein [Hydrogenophaga palleronii]MDR7150048.1 hypothetical protein [Hydrogenophaga palleronii]
MLLYATTAASIWMLLRRVDFARQDRERWVWQVLLMALIALGINKQLDLQSALTELGRIVAQREGWYESRRQTQLAFIAGAGILGLTFMVALLFLAWGSHQATLSALIGGFALLLFVMIRAASFHQVDRLLNADFAGLRYNWIIEMGGLTWILASSMRRFRNT